MGDRQQLIQSAVSFLRDPSAASSPLAQRVAFLESKGLTAPEIEQCLSLAQSASPATAGGGAYGGRGVMQPTREFERDWRDWFIMGVVGGAVGWLAFKLVNKYISPHLQPPSDSDLVAAQKALEQKYDEAAALLKELDEGTKQLTELVESQRKDVERDLEDLRDAIKQLKEGEKKREEWTTKVSNQVDEITRSLPSLIDRNANSQAQALQELQGELKSLKSLVITRRPASGSIPAGSSSSPTTTTTTGNNTATSPGIPSSASTPSLSFGGRPAGGLPSWQLSGTGAGLASSPGGLTGASYNANPSPSFSTAASGTTGTSTNAAESSSSTTTNEASGDSAVLVEKNQATESSST